MGACELHGPGADAEARAREGAAADFDAFAAGGAHELDLARPGDRAVAQALCRQVRSRKGSSCASHAS